MHSRYPFLSLIGLVLVLGPAYAQNQSIDTGCGANVGSVTNSNVSVHVTCPQGNGATLSIQYSRLFGAVEVPLLMGLFGQPKLTSARPWGPRFRAFAALSGETQLVNVDVIRFFDRIPYKDARPLLTKLWTDVSANVDGVTAIAWHASGGLRNERICYFATSAADESGSFIEELIAKKIMRNEKSCDKTIQEFDRRVGFTFIVIQNDSDQPVGDVDFQFRQNYDANRIGARLNLPDVADYFKSNELKKIPATGSATSNLIAMHDPTKKVESKVAALPRDHLFAARIEPKEKLIALLNIYIADKDRLPATYLGSGLIDHSQKMTTAAMQMADMNV